MMLPNCWQKWRDVFQVSQKELSEKLGISPSVISDYESERRKSPGVGFIRRIIEALILIDAEKGYPTVSKYKDLLNGFRLDVILDICEYSKSINSWKLAELINGDVVNGLDKNISGHTIVDSIKAILTLNSFDFYRLYGLNTQRALIFTGVSSGRSPMVAVRVANLKPAVVVLHGLNKDEVDKIAVKIAEIEKIPLITTKMEVDEMIRVLRHEGGV
jgi:putative transcriptional regulator